MINSLTSKKVISKSSSQKRKTRCVEQNRDGTKAVATGQGQLVSQGSPSVTQSWQHKPPSLSSCSPHPETPHVRYLLYPLLRESHSISMLTEAQQSPLNSVLLPRKWGSVVVTNSGEQTYLMTGSNHSLTTNNYGFQINILDVPPFTSYCYLCQDLCSLWRKHTEVKRHLPLHIISCLFQMLW